jgi:hypothetical protein
MPPYCPHGFGSRRYEAIEKPAVSSGFLDSGGGIRTRDLRVMSPSARLNHRAGVSVKRWRPILRQASAVRSDTPWRSSTRRVGTTPRSADPRLQLRIHRRLSRHRSVRRLSHLEESKYIVVLEEFEPRPQLLCRFTSVIGRKPALFNFDVEQPSGLFHDRNRVISSATQPAGSSPDSRVTSATDAAKRSTTIRSVMAGPKAAGTRPRGVRDAFASEYGRTKPVDD